jgi:hypothetical protein
MQLDELLKEKLNYSIAIGWIDLIIQAKVAAAGVTSTEHIDYFNNKAKEYKQELDAVTANILLQKTSLIWTKS